MKLKIRCQKKADSIEFSEVEYQNDYCFKHLVSAFNGFQLLNRIYLDWITLVPDAAATWTRKDKNKILDGFLGTFSR